MKENPEKNQKFISRHSELAIEGKTAAEIASTICQEFGINNHSYRAFKSRLKLGFGAQFDRHGNMLSAGRYTEAITPFMKPPSRIIPVAISLEVNGVN